MSVSPEASDSTEPGPYNKPKWPLGMPVPDWESWLLTLVDKGQLAAAAVWLIDQNHCHRELALGMKRDDLRSPEALANHREQLSRVIQSRQVAVAATQGTELDLVTTPHLWIAVPVVDHQSVRAIIELCDKTLVEPANVSKRVIQLFEMISAAGVNVAPLPMRRPAPPGGTLQIGAGPQPGAVRPSNSSIQVTPGDPVVDQSIAKTELLPGGMAAAPVGPPPLDAAKVQRLLLAMQSTIVLSDVAHVIANDVRMLLDADRVSLLTMRGKSIKVVAVSGQMQVQHRANLLMRLRKFVKSIVRTREPFLYAGSAEDLPDRQQKLLSLLLNESQARMTWVVPLIAPPPVSKVVLEQDEAPRREKPRPIVGALVIEQMGNEEPQFDLPAFRQHVTPYISAAVTNSKRYTELFGISTWATLGKLRSWLFGRYLAWTIVVSCLVAAAGIALVYVPWEYRVEATGKLMPQTQQDIFAPIDGQIVDVLVSDGERVSAGQIILKLRNDELQSELVTLQNELAEQRQLLASLQAQLDSAEKLTEKADEIRLQGKVVEARIAIDNLDRRLKLQLSRVDQVTVKAPIAGVVVTFQLDQLLRNRPVRRGESMLQIMDDKGDWQLELEVNEHRLGHLLKAQAAIGDAASAVTPNLADRQPGSKQPKQQGLKLSYQLLTRPEETYDGLLRSVASRSVISTEEGNVVEVLADIDQKREPVKTIGAEVRGRIGCGEKPLGYVLFGDVIEFVQRYVWW
jgi:multidrug efflux pump subunit AcrA (membrane-fusion protein)